MQRSDSARLALMLGLLLVLLGLSIPPPAAAGGGAVAEDRPVELIAELAHDKAVARSGHSAQPAPGGLLAVVPASGHVLLAHRSEPHGFSGEPPVAGRSTWSVRAPPVFAA